MEDRRNAVPADLHDRRRRARRRLLHGPQAGRAHADAAAVRPRSPCSGTSFLGVGAAEIDLFEGTIIDVEWVGNQWIALFDVVAVGGYSLRDVRDHTLRLSVVAALWGEDGPVRNKAWHPMATRPPQDPATWPQDQDGVVFMPVRDAVQTGQHPRMFKVKWRQTIDLLWDGSSWLWVEGGARTPAAFDVVL